MLSSNKMLGSESNNIYNDKEKNRELTNKTDLTQLDVGCTHAFK